MTCYRRGCDELAKYLLIWLAYPRPTRSIIDAKLKDDQACTHHASISRPWANLEAIR